ncbi:hypothetical protein DICVIV_05889, partial [Dictyocaulus viviparus]
MKPLIPNALFPAYRFTTAVQMGEKKTSTMGSVKNDVIAIVTKLPNCDNKTKMNDGLRAGILRIHNDGRLYIATDSRGGDKEFPLSVYPTAANMSLMGYDCDLENEAEKISKQCTYIYPRFENAGINSDIFSEPVTRLSIFYAVHSWWDKHSLDFYDLTPTTQNKTMIPFLQ